MINNIIDFLNINDSDIILSEYNEIGSTKYLTIEKKLKPEYCPVCGRRMHSKGIYIRTVKHPVLQNGFNVILKVKQRKWKCPNEDCNTLINDSFSFLSKNAQTTNLIPYNVVMALKDINLTLKQVADRFNISDNTVRHYLLQYVDIPRKELPEYLSIDEVYMNIDNDHKYVMVLMDFKTKKLVDLVISRREKDTSSYFLNIPLEERNKVKFVICDMYNPYTNFASRYFKYALTIVDSFHVISWLINELNKYIYRIRKRFSEQNKAELDEKNYRTNKNYKTTRKSKEMYILDKYRWVLLKNRDNIKYSTNKFYDGFLFEYLDTYDIEKKFLSLDKNFEYLRDMKELYISFNNRNIGKPEAARAELTELLKTYDESSNYMAHQFSKLLKKYFNEIVNSFNVIHSIDEEGNEIIRRLSNGPMESFNRNPKTYKRNSRGNSDFELTRLRIMLADDPDAPILAVPKKLNTIIKKPKK